MNFKDKLKEALRSRRMTQRELAKRIGVSEGTICRYVQGTRQVNIKTLAEICVELNVTADWLLGIESKRDWRTRNDAGNKEPDNLSFQE